MEMKTKRQYKKRCRPSIPYIVVCDIWDQDELRRRILDFLVDNPMEMSTFADELGIGYVSLNEFLRFGNQLSFKAVLKTHKYLKKALEEKSNLHET